jgi:hypothetical protein
VELVHEFTFTATLKQPVSVGPGPFGDRTFFEATEGKVTGDRLNGKVLSGGGDWILAGPDGFGRLDVRAILETDDDARIYVQYYGVIEYTDAVIKAVAGEKSSDYGDHYFRTTPRLETGDPRYAWVNQAVFVADGRIHLGPIVEYRVHRVT